MRGGEEYFVRDDTVRQGKYFTRKYFIQTVSARQEWQFLIQPAIQYRGAISGVIPAKNSNASDPPTKIFTQKVCQILPQKKMHILENIF